MTRATQEEKLIAEKRFIRITQAYKALTDEKAKKNYLEHGHPDGISMKQLLKKKKINGKKDQRDFHSIWEFQNG